MKLAKDYIDVGVQTNQREEMLQFWGETVGLPYEELLKVGGGNHQHRHTLNGSVFKMNHLRDPLPDGGPSGYDGVIIAREGVTEPQVLTDPEGVRVTLVPPGHRGVTHLGIEMRVSSLERFQHFYRDILQVEELAPDVFKWASTLFFLTEDKNHAPITEMRGRGFRYITVQVLKVDSEHQGVLDRGGTEGRAPMTLGSTARISFICDPDGNWIEISQRASLTGDLSPG